MYFKDTVPEKEEKEVKSRMSTAWKDEAVSSAGGSASMETSLWRTRCRGDRASLF